MAGNKYLSNSNGNLQEVASNNTSAGAGDADKLVSLNASGVLDATVVNSKTTSAGAGDSGKLPALDASGKLDNSFMPTGVGADTASIATSETLAAGDLINVWDNTGVFNVRKADATSTGKSANGFVLSAFTHPTTAVVYFEGSNTSVTGLTPGKRYLATTAGSTTSTPPSSSGNVVQLVGTAVSATTLNFQENQPIILA